ncbi:hypothetical protein AB0G04_40125 [Actinoplanes sp. NPDC023801]|uniref:YncE family protein n=1 Tax=Actinoplanes sp. NPDC023801 TaxID=3154595 RepID=UPI0033ED2662
MRRKAARTALAAAVIAGVSGYLFQAVTGTAGAAETLPVLVPSPPGVTTTNFSSIDRLVLDGGRRHVLVSDPTDGRLVSLNFDGTTAAQATGLPGVSGLALSEDSSTVYAAVEGENSILALRADTLEEINTYPVEGAPVEMVRAGNRLWYTTWGSFGSLDLTTGKAALHDHGDYNPWSSGSGELLIAASSENPDLIAVSAGPGITSGPVALYDISGGAARQIGYNGSVPYDSVTNFRDLEFTRDGLALAGYSGIAFLSLDAGLKVTGSYPMNASVEMDVADNGWLATGRPYSGFGHVLLLPAGATVPAREIRLETNSFDGGLGGLTWERGGGRLAAITTASGQTKLWVAEGPTRTKPAITLTAPAGTTRGAALTVTGRISESLPAGTPLSVRRTDEESPSGTALASVTTDASGAFRFTDQPQAGGTITYTVSYAGAGDFAAASGTARVTVPKSVPALTLTPSGTVSNYNAAVTVSARLGSTYRNRTVELWADPAGGDQANRLLKRATVDAGGYLRTSVRLTRNTVITATFTGDPRFAARSVKATLHTRVSVTTTVTGQYRTGGGYYYFKKAKHPVFTTTMTPSANRKPRLYFEYWSAGKWRAWRTSTVPMTSAGKSVHTLTGTHKTGVKYRVRAAYVAGTSGDSLNYTTYGPYRYFTFR